MAELTHYELLGVDRLADVETIRAAVRGQRRVWTQRQGLPSLEVRHEADRMTSRITEAERVLTDPAQRAAYDAALPVLRQADAPVPVPTATPAPTADAAPSPFVTPNAANSGASPLALSTDWIDRAKAWVLGRKILASSIAGGVVLLIVIIAAANSGQPPQSTVAIDDTSVSDTDTEGETAEPEPTIRATPAATTAVDLATDLRIENEVVYAYNSPYNFVTGLGREFEPSMVAATATASDTVVSYAGTGADARIVVWASVLHPAVDLTPETYEQVLVYVNPTTFTQTGTTALSTVPTRPDTPTLVGTPDGTVLLTEGGNSYAGTGELTSAYSAATGAAVWQREGAVNRIVGGLALIENMVAAEASPYGVRCRDVVAVVPATGTVTWGVDASQFADPEDNCGYIALTDPVVMDTDRWASSTYTAVRGYREQAIYLSATGAKVTWREGDDLGSGLADPVTGLVFSTYSSSTSAPRPTLVYDPVGGTSYFSLAADQAVNLDLQVEAFFNGMLYATTTSERLLIDARTGVTVSKDWTEAPIGVVEGWAIYRNGRMEKL
ncbi:hypothetical protein E3O06_11490 [Cryobacterium glaciale]|uniref:J domain-containing protein n=1 Tax=Cryobacterium glaciale TaxID=1259145 RepID=A0A4R8UWK2_9MICO|nr:hypothetical protein [Cryobacterium glaciale]TFB71877.1 hypothetical protein E3O06_11490 [Cryobacterium glaciale]